MDSEVLRDGRVLDLTDDAWREDRLPYEDVTIPLSELPESEQDNGGSTESVKEQEMKCSFQLSWLVHRGSCPLLH
uniref:Anaphase-promoting complex subunit 13 n=1 Tax=Cyprinus carpio carpio TaxID=630221 RepID=A0A9J8APB7_CYPCA